MKTFFCMNTPTKSIPSNTWPIIRAISPPLRYSGKLVTNKCTKAVEAMTAIFVWNMNEFSQVFPSTIG